MAQTSNGSNILYFLPHRLGRPVWAGGVTEAIRTVSRKPSGFRAAVPARAKAREGAAARLPPRPPHGPRAPLRNRRVSRAARPARSRFRRRRRASQRRLRRSAVWGPNPATGSGRARPKPRRDTAPCLWDARGRPGCANARRGRALRCRHGGRRAPGLPEPQVRARIAPPQRLRRLGRVLKVHLSAQVALASGGRRCGGVVWFDRASCRVLSVRPLRQR